MGLITEKELKKQLNSGEAPVPTSGTATVASTELELAFTPTDRSLYELVDMTKDKRFIYENNHVRFVYAKEGETPETLAKEFGIRKKKLCKYNLITRPDEAVFHQGDVVYLEQLRKRNWKAKKYITEGGETVRDLALRFAVRPEKIIKRNDLEPNVVLKPGQKIKLR